MPTNQVPNLSQRDLKQLKKLLNDYARHIASEQALAGQVISLIAMWVDEDIDPVEKFHIPPTTGG